MSADDSNPPADLRDLASRLSCASPSDELVLEGLNHLQALRSDVGPRDDLLRGCLDAACALLRSMNRLGGAAAEDVRDRAVRLLYLAHDMASRRRRSRPTLDSIPPALPSATSRAGLAMINGIAVGEVMVRLGLITPEQVDEALRRQAKTGKKFGETLVELGCSREAVLRGLTVQKSLSRPVDVDGDGNAGPIQTILLGEILVRMGKIDRGQLEQGLAHQERTNMRIGAALVALGFVSWMDVAEGLREQQRYASHAL